MEKILSLESIEILDLICKRVVIINKDAEIVHISKEYCKFLNVSANKVIGRKVKDIIENTRMHKVLESGEGEYSQIQKINGRKMIATRIPIIKEEKLVGVLGYVNYKDTKEVEELYNKISEMEKQINSYRNRLKSEVSSKYSLDSIKGESEVILNSKSLLKKSALSNSTVLILGESGTGKELFAHAIHSLSNRRNKPFITVNCSAIPSELLESELFGYEKGAFTGANKEGKVGKFELANNGTIFLDEIGDMPLFMQSKILRILQEKEVERIGGNSPIKLNIRIIAATNRDLETMVKEKSFREDLFYRLNVIKIKVPPLRERDGDIELLSYHFLNLLSVKIDKNVNKISKDALILLNRYSWPGNIRELRNVIERSLNMIDDSDELNVKYLPDKIKNHSVIDDVCSLDKQVYIAEKKAIYKALLVCKGNKSLAANKLGISRVTLYEKLKKYKIEF
ncbi:sigma 54-interacting transcriptional regulator [Clostridium sp.]|uniref:sigma-54 interaction domain-containing protein n=1 Tax=Clostridium sp. TaxID=1506 RepID=UPI002909D66B|nr:sigma 54-interacting transcriptional regulator [Clostridium sp.]MDU5106898.1 sigma 54-interacting transcriptional regulator [Clostridium sp.]